MDTAPRGRRRTITAFVATLCCGLAVAPVAHAAFGDRTLKRGSRGHDVRVLQSWLTHLGVRTAVDGIFGAGTERRLKTFERRQRWRVDGKLTPRDARKMRELMAQRFGANDLRTTEPAAGRQVFLGARRKPSLEVAVFQPGPVTVEVVRADSGEVVDVVTSEAPAAGPHTVAWDGFVGKKPAPEAVYYLRLAGESLARAAAAEGERFSFHHHKFPVRGKHSYGDDNARFGSARDGHAHQGQDVFAECGTNVVAAQGGKVIYSGYHSAAGNYIVIRGAGSGEDYVYMHLERPSRFKTGATVSTGRSIGTVGDTGNARGCHLHFELWSAPGWYEGGEPYDPYRRLRAWDRCC